MEINGDAKFISVFRQIHHRLRLIHKAISLVPTLSPSPSSTTKKSTPRRGREVTQSSPIFPSLQIEESHFLRPIDEETYRILGGFPSILIKSNHPLRQFTVPFLHTQILLFLFHRDLRYPVRVSLIFVYIRSIHPFSSLYMAFLRPFLLFCLISVSFAHEAFDSHLLPRPLILEFPQKVENQLEELDGEIKLRCDSWRFNAEANNLSPWRRIPLECAEYVKEYSSGRAYQLDVETASKEAEIFAKSVKLVGDGKDVWIFDIDETLLSNLPYYTEHGYG